MKIRNIVILTTVLLVTFGCFYAGVQTGYYLSFKDVNAYLEKMNKIEQEQQRWRRNNPEAAAKADAELEKVRLANQAKPIGEMN